MAGGPCTVDSDWVTYVVVSLVTFIGGVVILLPARVMWYFCCVPRLEAASKTRRKTGVRTSFSRLRAIALGLISGHTVFSKVLLMCIWLLNLAAIIIYLIDASEFTRRDCGTVRDNVRQLVWLALCCAFIVFYVIRFVAAPDKLFMWIDLYSVVDHFTIGPTFVAFYFDSNWLGLKFLRLLWLLKLPEVLQMMSVVKTQRSIRLVHIGAILIGSWMASSGFVHLSENSGDPHEDWDNWKRLTYWECVYWLLVTMSTVGYGEISPSTDITRAFIVVFIMGAFVMFSSFIPEIAMSMQHSSKYNAAYKRTYGRRQKPNLELEAFFKRHFTDVTFIQSTVMEIPTLQKVKLQYADACVVLADRKATDPDEEDSSNIVRVTAIKNYCPSIKVIVQLLLHQNKLHLLHIPSWNWKHDHSVGDEVICISELKLGIMAQSCLAPGFCTLLSNLFTMRSYRTSGSGSNGWMANYRYGAGHEIYVEAFSAAFYGMTFSKAVETCYVNWAVLLVALNIGTHRGKKRLKVNPGSQVMIGPNTTGFFLAQSPEVMRRVASYTPDSAKSAQVGVPMDDMDRTKTTSTSSEFEQIDDLHYTYLETVGSRLASYGGKSPAGEAHDLPRKQPPEMLNASGQMHWCPAKKFEDCVLDVDTARDYEFRGHVVVCLASTDESPVTGLVNFIMPLRTSNFRSEELKDIVILTKSRYIEKEWRHLANFPKIYIFEGSALYRSDLKDVHLHHCDMCVILSAPRPIMVDQNFVDKDAVLSTLTIKGMLGQQLEHAVHSLGFLGDPETFRPHATSSSEIPLLTELEIDSNVLFLDQEDDDDPEVPLYLTMPYISGSVFANSALASLMSCAYLNPESLTLVRALIVGAETAEFEQILTDGLGIVRKQTLTDVSGVRERSRLGQLSLQYGPLEKLEHNSKYGELLKLAMSRYGILCLGLYRLIDPVAKDPRTRRRYVMTNPGFNTKLETSDKVYVLVPYNLEDGSSPVQPKRSKTASLMALDSMPGGGPDPDSNLPVSDDRDPEQDIVFNSGWNNNVTKM